MSKGMRTLLLKLRNRHIIETFVGYVAGGWLFIEVVERLLVGYYRLPEKIIDISVVTIVGLLASLLTLKWFRGAETRLGNVRAEILLIPLLAIATLAVDVHFVLQILGAPVKGLILPAIGVLAGVGWVVFKSLQWAAQSPGTGRTGVAPSRAAAVIPGRPVVPASPAPYQASELLVKDLARGSTFAGRYDIIEELGRGGMGKVYRVFDRKIDEEVALKLIRPDIAGDPETIGRFRNELKLSRKISHRHVCRIHDLGEEEGTYYITMEYVPGEDLRSLIHISKQLSVGTAVSIAKQVCEGLGEAHRLGVIHRDLKPGNIMIDKDGNARIMDFGIARSLKGKSITDTGIMIGTPQYMSPEQVEGKEIDQRSDLYSLGIILYEMVTGRVPFDGATPFVIGVKQKSELPTSPKELNPQIPDALSLAILRCLEKDKAQRYQTAWELGGELDAIEKGIPTTQRGIPERKPSTSREITVKFDLKRLLITASAVVLCIAAALVIRHLLPAGRPEPVPKIDNSVAVISFENQTGDKAFDYLQKAIPNLLTTNLEKSGILYVATWERLHDLLKQIKGGDAEVIDNELGFEICRREGIKAIVLGSFVKAGNMFAIDVKVLDVETKRSLKSASSRGEGPDSILRTQIDDLSREIAQGIGIGERTVETAKLSVAEVTTSSLDAYKEYLEGVRLWWADKESIGLGHLEKAVALDPSFASAYYWLARTRYYVGQAEAGNRALERAKALSSKVTERERLFIEVTSGDAKESDKVCREIIRKYPKEKEAHFYIGVRLMLESKLDEAIPYFNRTIELDPWFAYAYYNLAGISRRRHEYRKAEEILKRYQALRPDDPNLLDRLAWLHWDTGERDMAMKEFEGILANDPGNRVVLEDLVNCCALIENYPAVMKWLDVLIASGPRDMRARGYVLKAFFSFWLNNTEEFGLYTDKATESANELGDEPAKNSIIWLKRFSSIDRGRFDDGAGEFEFSVKRRLGMDPVNSAYYKSMFGFVQGFAALSSGDVPAARSALAELDAQSGQLSGLVRGQALYYRDFLKAEVLIAEGRPAEAASILEKASIYEYFSDFPLIQYIFGDLPLYKDGVARAHIQMGNIDKAIAEYRKLMTYDPRKKDNFFVHPLYHYRLARLYEQKLQPDKAREEYRKFLDLWKTPDPVHPEIADARERLSVLTAR